MREIVLAMVPVLIGMLPATDGGGHVESTEQLVQGLVAQGVSPGCILGADANGIPRVCGSGIKQLGSLGSEQQAGGLGLPPNTRSWECVPGVIRSDGDESFRLEVNVNGPVNSVVLDSVSSLLVPPAGTPIVLLDDGLGEDFLADDGVYTTGPFRFESSGTMPPFYMNDTTSPAGLAVTSVGDITITETDASETTFLIRPEIGLLSEDISESTVVLSVPGLTTTPHLINIRGAARETQLSLRLLGGDLRNLTTRIYETLPDAFDFLVFLSAEKIERLPRISSSNFIAGIHLRVRTNYTGTGSGPLDLTASYGSDGRLLGTNVLDAYARGMVGRNVTHELTHQWSSFTSASLGLSDGTGHYKQRSSVGSLVGGFQWIDNGNGTFTLNCGEGRNGATHAPPIDLYMMGLVEGDAVPASHVNETISFAADCGELVESLVDVTIDDIQGVHGVRDPGPESAQRNFRIAFVVESHNRLLNPTELTYYEVLAEHYTRPIPPGEPAPYVGSNWPSVVRFFGEGTTWTTTLRVSDMSIPAASRWGMVAMALLVLGAGSKVLGKRTSCHEPRRASLRRRIS